jgi:rhamnosyltransferase
VVRPLERSAATPTTNVACVVPGHNPDPDAIHDLVRSLLGAGTNVIVADDCSDDASYLEAISTLGAATLRHTRHAGIARSLNDGLRFAAKLDASWLLTVDQDTVLPSDYVESLLVHVDPRAGVIGAEVIGDASGDLRYPSREVDGQLLTDEVFQTGSLWSVPAMSALGGFDESLGIDAVDAEACLKLREVGLGVVLARGVRLNHHYGAGRQVSVLGRTVVATGHSPARRESLVRNRLALFPREFHQSPIHALRTLRRVAMNVLLGVTVEDGRWAKAKGAARGLRPHQKR